METRGSFHVSPKDSLTLTLDSYGSSKGVVYLYLGVIADLENSGDQHLSVIVAPVTRIILMNANTSTLPPPVAMLQLITGYWVSRAVFVFAKLGIADRLAAGSRTAADLAGDVRVDP